MLDKSKVKEAYDAYSLKMTPTSYEYFNLYYSLSVLKKLNPDELAIRLFASKQYALKNNCPKGYFGWAESGRADTKEKQFGSAKGYWGGQEGVLLDENNIYKLYVYKKRRESPQILKIEKSEAAQIAKKIRELFEYCNNLLGSSSFDSTDDYVSVYERIKKYIKALGEQNLYWDSDGDPDGLVLKYFHCSFPDKFACWYAGNKLEEILKKLISQEEIKSAAFVRSGQLSLYTNEIGASNQVFGFFISDVLIKNNNGLEGTVNYTAIPTKVKEQGEILKFKKNVILQGAPGTGKTYSTAALALYIIGQKEPNAIAGLDFNDHKSVMERYEQYRDKKKQIAFCTFHQSMDYEDFVEGLRPEVINNGSAVTYKVKSGIFKDICKNASSANTDRVDNFEDVWSKLSDILTNEDFVMIPLSSKKREMRIELNENGDGLTERTYPNDEYVPGNWIDGHSKFFSKDQLYNIYRGLPGVPAGGNDNYRKAIVEYMKKKLGLKDFTTGTQSSEDKNYVLIIDEINRGYVSKIFGELITLLEKDKRIGAEHPIIVKLPYSNDDFGVPSNLFIIGTMNTTDRTTGTLDYALRRRFDFITLEADPSVLDTSVPEAKEIFEDVEQFIRDKKLDDMDISDLMVGHSYFMAKDKTELKTKIQYEVVPLIKEYIKDGILNCPPSEAKVYFDDWMKPIPHKKANDNTTE